MANPEELLKAVTLLEKQFKMNGMWAPPSYGVPQLKIDSKWDDLTQVAAQALNRMAIIRSLPDCARFFGAVRDSMLDAFKQDYLSGPERMGYVTTQFNRLRADVGILPRIDSASVPKLET